MRRVFGLAIVAALLLATAARAQLINDLEKRLDGAKGAAPALTIPMPGYLGMVPDEEYKGDDGVKVVSVKPGGPADASGLKPGDLITSIDDKPIRTVDAMDAALTTASAGQKLKIAVRRAGGPQTLTVTLGSRPSATPAADVGEAPPAAAPPTLNPPTTSPFDPLTPPAAATPPAPAASGPIRSKPLDPLAPPAAATPAETPAASPPAADPLGAPAASSPAAPGGGASLGITVVPLSDEARAAYGLSLRSGALITAVKPGSPADRAGLPLGGVIAMIDGRRIGTADELVSFVRAARPGQEVELGYYQGEVLRRKLVTLAPAASAAIPAAPAVTGGQPPIFGNDRPILNRVERMVEGVAGGRGPSTVFDPSELATLKIQVLDLTAQVKALEERLKRLEGGGAAPPAPAPGLGGFTPAP
ncbi:MAG TPA: PDZ domain-containing protein [Pirellulaceae bacterium]|nr:PDZ domain-containing protein [Pirellulaceae bacterium]